MKVLVVVDMQNDFIDGTLGTPEAQAIVPKVVKKIKEFDGEVLWTQDTHSDDYLETQEGRLLPVEHCISASNGWQIHSSVKAAIQSKHPVDDQLNGFEKKTFGSLALAGRLYPEVAFGDGIEEIVLVGLCTDICVISNALLLKAFMPEVKIKVALLLHDIGKPQCYTEDENGGHFHGHGVPSRDIAEQVLDRLRFDNKTKQEVLELVLYHDTMIEPTPRTVRKWLHKLGERRFSQFLDVRMADILAHAEGTQESRIERCIALGSIMSEVLEAEQCFALKDLQINGRDIMNLGIEQGKRVGEILNSLLDEVISGALENEHNALMQRAVELLG